MFHNKQPAKVNNQNNKPKYAIKLTSNLGDNHVEPPP